MPFPFPELHKIQKIIDLIKPIKLKYCQLVQLSKLRLNMFIRSKNNTNSATTILILGPIFVHLDLENQLVKEILEEQYSYVKITGMYATFLVLCIVSCG